MDKKPRIDIPRVNAEADLVALAQKAGLAVKKQGNDHWACCPFHSENTPSFSIFEKAGVQRYKCFGCDARGDALSFVQAVWKCGLREAADIITGGAAPIVGEMPGGGVAKRNEARAASDAAKAKFNRDQAKILYDNGYPAHSGGVAAYLAARGIPVVKLPYPGGVPPILRINPSLEYPSKDGFGGGRFPAMLAPITMPDGRFMAVHRTYLRPDYRGKAAVPMAKLALGLFRGGMIWLDPPGQTLAIAEGIETALSVKAVRPELPVAVAVSLGNFLSVEVPDTVREIIVLGDNDMKPPEPGKRDPKKNIFDGARRLKYMTRGRKVSISWARPGMDFNDMLQEGSL
jgi:DNA primase